MRNKILKGTVVVAASSLIVKMLSIVYKIPYQNVTGDMGFYILQQLYPLFALLVTFSTFALPLALSEHKENEDFNQIIKSTFFYQLIVSSLLAIFIIVFRISIANLYGDERLSIIFIALALAVWLAPINGIIRSLLNSQVRTIHYVGYSTIIEQVTRVLLILFALILFHREVITDPYQLAMLSYYAFSVGMLITISIFFFKINYNKDQNSIIQIGYWVKILKRTFYLLLVSSILILLYLIDSFTIVNLLGSHHSIDEAKVIKGMYDRSLPLIQATVFFVSPILSTYLPHIQDVKKKTAYGQLINIILFLAMPATLGMVIVLNDLNQLLFKDGELTNVLQLSSIIVVLYALVLTITSVSIKRKQMMMIIIGALVVKYLLNIILVMNEGIIGAPIASIVSLTLMFILLMISNKNEICIDWTVSLKILIASGMMAGILLFLINLLKLESLILKGLIGIVSYILLILLLKVVNWKDLKQS